ncbi:MAG: ASKHA domain-containing protein [Deltaproteobacteria bacterium]|nr:ASKHA domain-containing protein [Deltaproteobacteria bacterium]
MPVRKMTPFVLPVPVTADQPSLQDNTADLDRLRHALGLKLLAVDTAGGALGVRPLEIPFARIVPLCRRFRQAGFSGVALVNDLPDRWVLADFLPQSPGRLPAMALDLGTTHLEATLVDLLTGQVLFSAGRENSQIEYGADILSRIHQATSVRRQMREVVDLSFLDPGLAVLQQSIVACINALIVELASGSGVAAEDIRALSVSGNTTMTHLLLGLDPFHICREPYIPMVNVIEPMESRELGLILHEAAPVWIMPSAGSYFGGDLISGILASGLAATEQTRMLIDVGTNAEVVLGNRDWLIACAGAAGPALEGGVARMGMRAAPGAIDFVSLDPETYALEVRTIGGAPARGLCGSGLIDLVASLYLARIIDIRGKFRDPDQESDPARAAFMRERLVERDGQRAFVVVTAEAGDGDEVLLEQIDLDAMIRSKAAMYAVLATLVGQVGLAFEDLAEICVAGAFGNHINPQRAITLGMLPDLDLSVYRAIGNSSLQGAEQVLFSRSARQECLDIVSKITYVELNVNQDFMIRFSGARFIPHTDPTLFPSVPLFAEQEEGAAESLKTKG